MDEDKALQAMLQNLVTMGNADVKEFDVEGMPKVLMDAFHGAHFDAVLDSAVPASRSGTTCVVCVINKRVQKMYVANVGDSSCVLVTDSGGGRPKWSVLEVTQKTTVDAEEEERRITRSEGRVVGGNMFYGPVGIAMTRALGDAVMLRAGVLPTPTIRTVDLPEDGAYIVMGSDGVFDVLTLLCFCCAVTPDAVMGVVDRKMTQEGSVQLAAEAIAEEARQKWLGGLPVEVRVDDISCVVIKC